MAKTRTNSKEVVLKSLSAVKKEMAELRRFLDITEQSLDICIEENKKGPGSAFAIGFVDNLMESLLRIMCETSRANGAVLVDEVIEEKK